MPTRATVLAWLLLAVSSAAQSPAIGLGDLKKKTQEKVKEQIEKKVPDTPPGEAESGGEAGEQDPGSSGAEVPIAKISTKFDFVPGDVVLYADDFSGDAVGEFPARLRLLSGTFEVVEFEGSHWMMLAGESGEFQLKSIPILPERWTLEFDLHGETPIRMEARAPSEGPQTWWVDFGTHGNDAAILANGRQSATTLASGDFSGHHHISFMVQGKSVKVYVDHDRIMNVPEIETVVPEGTLTFRMRDPRAKPLISNFRFAEISLPKKDLLAEGPFVTHGIYFASGSDHVLPESAPVLRQMAAYMKDHPVVRVRITGHTDDVGSEADNLDLSTRRAAAVAGVLVADFGQDAARFESDGKGESQPTAKNDTPEGRATNRRVEFAKVE